MTPIHDNGLGVGNGLGQDNTFSVTGMGSLVQARNTLFMTTPGRDYGQGGVLTHFLGNMNGANITERMSRSKDFEDRAIHRMFRTNRENSKDRDFLRIEKGPIKNLNDYGLKCIKQKWAETGQYDTLAAKYLRPENPEDFPFFSREEGKQCTLEVSCLLSVITPPPALNCLQHKVSYIKLHNLHTRTLFQITHKDYAHFLYVKYMERLYDKQHVGSSIALINLDNDKQTTEMLIGAPHRYRFAMGYTV